jgi:hypothetical protein
VARRVSVPAPHRENDAEFNVGAEIEQLVTVTLSVSRIPSRVLLNLILVVPAVFHTTVAVYVVPTTEVPVTVPSDDTIQDVPVIRIPAS